MNQNGNVAALNGVLFKSRRAFWFGVVAVSFGVAAHIPMYLKGRGNGYKLANMPMDSWMLFGMAAIAVGMISCFFGLYVPRPPASGRGIRKQFMARDDTKLTRSHMALALVMCVAVTIDIMKPTTLGFVMPGMAIEYGLKSPLNPNGTLPVALVSLSGITGTVIGSLVWGLLADQIGRRASILYAGILFISTSMCGAMPNFYWNLVMCFMMGVGAGGMLPICFALLSEIIPSRHRGWLMILVGGDIAGAYIITSWLAAALVPTYSWRILWLIGLPTGCVFIFLNRWIPESPRFLLERGMEEAARALMERFNMVALERKEIQYSDRSQTGRSFLRLTGSPYTGMTVSIGGLALGSGLILFGFNLWMPTNLRSLGIENADFILRNSALLGFPITFAVAWLYGFWSTKRTIVFLSMITALSLAGFVFAPRLVTQNVTLLHLFLAVPICGINSLTAVLCAYSAEVYPTAIRAQGTGLAAGLSKAGGVLVIALVALGVTVPNLSTIATMGALPLAIASVIMAKYGVETRMKSLEEICPVRAT